jgi:hypothetical protein
MNASQEAEQGTGGSGVELRITAHCFAELACACQKSDANVGAVLDPTLVCLMP